MGTEDANEKSYWYAVRTKSKQEDRASANLNAWQVQTFAPMLKERQSSVGSGHYVTKPLFSRYIFARFDASRFLHRIKYTRGVENVVSFGGYPVPIDDRVIDLIKQHLGEDGFIQLDSELKCGDSITVKSGAFKSFVGIFQGKVKNSNRVRILLDTMKYQTHLLIDREMIGRTT
jgi:transcriptional antiterminator RfaH